jgi:diguanylate cyclase (GGDEF)-like protein
VLKAWRRPAAKPDGEASTRGRHAEALAAAIEAFGAGGDVRATMRAIARASSAALNAERASVWVVDSAVSLARVLGQSGDSPAAPFVSVRLDDPDLAALFSTGGLAIAHDRTSDSGQALARQFKARSLVAMPFLRGDAVAGVVLATCDRAHRDWSAEDITTLSALAMQAGLALERANLAAHSQRLSFEDPLTGLPNRSLFLDRLSQALAAAEHKATPLALCVLNLDGFKDVNAALGHAAGDSVLREVAHRLRSALRAHETVARLGGDEFAVLLPAHQHTAEVVAERVLRALSGHVVVANQNVAVPVSMGIAVFPEHGDGAATLLRRAEAALANAKRAQSGFAVAAAEDDAPSAERFMLIGGLRQALAGTDGAGRLELHYQPKVDCQSGTPVGAEALVRWRHPTLGMVMPLRFIPLAEQTGLIKPLTRWALDAALHQCQTWLARGWRLGVAVNLSAADVQDAGLPDFIAEVLERYAVPSELLTVEITESMLVEDPTRAFAVLSRLNEMGVRASLDDFGTGYSSLAYLKRLPVHELKIDRSFVTDLVRDARDQAIVSSTIGLGHSLGMQVVAEGIEDQATLDCLRSLGNDIAQGYFLSRPKPAAELDTWLAAHLDVATKKAPAA